MGQYHALTCPDAGSYVSLTELGAGAKAVEQVWSECGPAVLALLCASGLDDHPRSLPWTEHGTWAGHRPLMIGDYGNADDLIQHDPRLNIDEAEIQGKLSDRQAGLWMTPRPLKKLRDLSSALIPVIERALGCRASDLCVEGRRAYGKTRVWREFVKVKQDQSSTLGWDLDVDHLPEDERQRLMDYYEQTGVLGSARWRRSPVHIDNNRLPSAPDAIPSSSDGTGDHLLWVNLDRREYVDPLAFNDSPDLAGVMVGRSSRAIMAMLYHFESRGGGDLRQMGPLSIVGRWRGDRIVLMGSKGFKPKRQDRVHQADVRADFVDISGNAYAFMHVEDAFCEVGISASVKHPYSPNDLSRSSDLNPIARDALRAAMTFPQIRSCIEAGDFNSLDHLYISLASPLRVVAPAYGAFEEIEFRLAPTFEVRTFASQKLALSPESQQAIAKALAALPIMDCVLTAPENEGTGSVTIPNVGLQTVALAGMSHHERLSLVE